MNQTDKRILALIFRTGFTFKGDSCWASYRQATNTLNRLERMGLVHREENAYRLTDAGREAHLWPDSLQMAVAA